MSINVTLGVVLLRKRIKSKQLANKIGTSEQNLSLLKNNRTKGISFKMLSDLCKSLDCEPKDLLEYVPNNNE